MQTPIGREGERLAMDSRGAMARPILAEQLKEYQARSKHELASLSFFSSPNPSSTGISSKSIVISRVQNLLLIGTGSGSVDPGDAVLYIWGDLEADDVLYVIWELFIFAFLVFSAVSLYFRYMRVALILICVTAFLLVSMKIAKEIRKNRKSKRRMLLPLSM